jgi:hypothetical protein
LGIAEAPVNTGKPNESNLIYFAQVFHTQVPDLFAGDFFFVVIENMRFDFGGQFLDCFRLEGAFPTGGSQASLYFGTTEILAGSVPLADLQETFHPFVGGKSASALVAKTTSANRLSVFHDSGVADTIIVAVAVRASHEG